MSVSINIPDDLYQEALAIANEQHLSVEDLFSTAFASHVAAWERLKNKAANGSREKYVAALAQAPDVEPDDFDRF